MFIIIEQLQHAAKESSKKKNRVSYLSYSSQPLKWFEEFVSVVMM